MKRSKRGLWFSAEASDRGRLSRRVQRSAFRVWGRARNAKWWMGPRCTRRLSLICRSNARLCPVDSWGSRVEGLLSAPPGSRCPAPTPAAASKDPPPQPPVDTRHGRNGQRTELYVHQRRAPGIPLPCASQRNHVPGLYQGSCPPKGPHRGNWGKSGTFPAFSPPRPAVFFGAGVGSSASASCWLRVEG